MQESRNESPGRLPAILGSEKAERLGLDFKESDFIRNMKRAKSIMIAHKNRKQKNVLSSYFLNSGRQKQDRTALKQRASHFLSIEKKKNELIVGQQHEDYLYSQIQNSLNICLSLKRMLKNKEHKLEPVNYSAVDMGAYLMEKSKKKKEKPIPKIQIEENFCIRSSQRYVGFNTQKYKIDRAHSRSMLDSLKDAKNRRLFNKNESSEPRRYSTEQNGEMRSDRLLKSTKIGRWQIAQHEQQPWMQ